MITLNLTNGELTVIRWAILDLQARRAARRAQGVITPDTDVMAPILTALLPRLVRQEPAPALPKAAPVVQDHQVVEECVALPPDGIPVGDGWVLTEERLYTNEWRRAVYHANEGGF